MSKKAIRNINALLFWALFFLAFWLLVALFRWLRLTSPAADLAVAGLALTVAGTPFVWAAVALAQRRRGSDVAGSESRPQAEAGDETVWPPAPKRPS